MKKELKIALIVVAVVIVFALMIAGIFALVFSLLDRQKASAEYKVAYEYLIGSETFEELRAEPDQIRFNSYHISTVNGESTATLGFIVKGRSYEVVCHKEEGRWTPCRECTKFD